MEFYSLYVHIPFCRQRCSYCDFNTYAGIDHLIPEYARAVSQEAIQLGKATLEPLHIYTLYFGGGTPSIMPFGDIETILKAISTHFRLAPGLEFSMEANPGTITRSYLRDLRSMGVNRLSLGMQSAHLNELSLLGRQHTLEDVIKGVDWARQAGFNQINLDLMFGLPNQTVGKWQESLMKAISLRPTHLSIYALTIESGTPLGRRVKQRLVSKIDDDLAADMYEWTSEVLDKEGFKQYEISNWASQAEDNSSYVCKHNLQYWLNKPYLGLGAGAHGYAGGVRTANALSPQIYIQRCRVGDILPFPTTPATQRTRKVEKMTEMKETMFMGLRLTQEGVNDVLFQRRFGLGMRAIFGEKIDRLVKQGLLEWCGMENKCLRLTKRGILLGNRVFMEFV